MPSHPQRPSLDTRASNLELKRKRGAIRLNCAECRRLKLRCDRSNPCGSCVKRGCGAICPDGSLVTGQGRRFATTEELHEKNLQLCYRIRHLEEALHSLYSDRSMDRHPLLSEELLKMKTPLPREPLPPRSSNTFILTDEINQGDATGLSESISVYDPGVSRYYGHTANSLFFLQNGQQSGTYAPDEVFNNLQYELPPDILTKASMMPVSYCPVSDKANLQHLLPYLPPQPVLHELRTTYYTYASWMYDPVPEEMFDKEIFSVFYGSGTGVQLHPGDPSVTHKLSVIFMILAIGSVMDPSLPSYNMEAEKFHQLARAALFQSSLFELATRYAVHALFLMSFYLFLMDRNGAASESRWVIMGIAVKIGQSIGLHKDSAQWNLDTAETQHRRELFWEILTLDSWQSLTFGRPPSFSPHQIDCKTPFPDCGGNANAKTFHAWKHQFTSECMSLLHEQTLGTDVPTYSAIVQLDKKICYFPSLPELSSDNNSSVCGRDIYGLALQRHTVLAIREIGRLCLHRRLFAKAITDYPNDPLQSPYCYSIQAIGHCAQNFIRLMQDLYTQTEPLCSRLWFLWAHMLSCSVILASTVIRCPSMQSSPTTLAQLESASELFSKVARGFRAVDLLEIMRHLQRKACHYLNEYQRMGSFNFQKATPYSDPLFGGRHIDEVALLQGNVCINAKLGLSHSPSPQVPPSLTPSPLAFAPNVPGAELLPRGVPIYPRTSVPETWNQIPRSDRPATDTGLITTFNRPNTSNTSSPASVSSYQSNIATEAPGQSHPPLSVDHVTSYSIGSGGHDYHGTSQMEFLETQDGTFNAHYFSPDQMLIAPVPALSRMSSESSLAESRVRSAWKDLAPDLQLR